MLAAEYNWLFQWRAVSASYLDNGSVVTFHNVVNLIKYSTTVLGKLMNKFCVVPGAKLVSVLVCFLSMTIDVTTQTELLLPSSVSPEL